MYKFSKNTPDGTFNNVNKQKYTQTTTGSNHRLVHKRKTRWHHYRWQQTKKKYINNNWLKLLASSQKKTQMAALALFTNKKKI